MTPQRQSRVTGAVALMISQAVVLFLGYITHPWIGRLLGPEAYGIYGLVLAVQSIVSLILTLGVPSSISRFVARHEDQAQSILKKTLILQTGVALSVSLLTFLLAPVIAHLLQDDFLTHLIQFVALVIFLQAFYNIYTQFFSGMHLFTRQALLTSFYAVTKLIGAISLIYVINIYGAFSGFALGGLAAAILGWFWTRNVGGNKPTSLTIKDFLSFAGVYVLILLGLQLVMSLDLFMVKAFLDSDSQAGFYNAASTLARIPYILLQAIAFILLPSVSSLTKPGASHDKAATFIRDTLRYLIALIVPAIGLAAATSKSLITLFYSSKYISAAPALTILMVGLGALAFFLLVVNIVAGAGRAKVGFIFTTGMVVISAALGFILIPRFGLLGAAWQTTITSLIGLAVLSVYTFQTFKIQIPIRSIINILIASAGAVGVTYLWKATTFTLIPQYILALAVYGAVLLILQEVKPGDRQLLSQVHPLLKWVAPKKS